MEFGRRSILGLLGGGLLPLGTGCLEGRPDHRRGLTLQLSVIDHPPADARTVDLEAVTTEQSLLYRLGHLLLNGDRETLRRYDRRDGVSVSRGPTSGSGSEEPYLHYRSTRFRDEHAATQETLGELPEYDLESDGPQTTIYLQYNGTAVRLQYRILYSTPT